jgi:hypothetical protein
VIDGLGVHHGDLKPPAALPTAAFEKTFGIKV